MGSLNSKQGTEQNRRNGGSRTACHVNVNVNVEVVFPGCHAPSADRYQERTWVLYLQLTLFHRTKNVIRLQKIVIRKEHGFSIRKGNC